MALGTTLGVLAALGLSKGLAVYGFVFGVFVGAAAYGCFSEFALELYENICCGQRPCAYRSLPCTAPRNADGRGSILFADTSSSSLKISFWDPSHLRVPSIHCRYQFVFVCGWLVILVAGGVDFGVLTGAGTQSSA